MASRTEDLRLRNLLKPGLGDDATDELVERLVTLHELRDDVAELRNEFVDLRGEMRSEMGRLRGEFGELRGEFGELRGEFGELRGEFGELRGDMANLETRIANALRTQTLVVAGLILSGIAAVGVFGGVG